MSDSSILPLLKARGLRDTQPRRLVVRALYALARPAQQKEVWEWIAEQDAAISLVTVYRILKAFEERHIVHRHLSTGGFTLCSLPHQPGHHGFLSCTACGEVAEFAEPDLCRIENRIAERVGFHPLHHMSEIVGTCRQCAN